MKFEWELIFKDEYSESYTYRLKVFGGWLIRYQHMYKRSIPDRYTSDKVINNSMVFIPDPEHKWEIDNDN